MNKSKKIFINIINLSGLDSTKKKVFVYISAVMLVLAADLYTKYLVEKHLVQPYVSGMLLTPEQGVQRYLEERVVVNEKKVITPFWTFSYVRNYGIGFSVDRFLNSYMPMDKKSRIMGLLQLVAVLLALTYLVYNKFEYMLPFMMVTAGGLGNVVDRFYRGYVVDFIKWRIPGSPLAILDPWPLFNIADACITVGGGLLLAAIVIDIIQQKGKVGGQAEKPTDTQ